MDAVLLARAVPGRAVRVQWTREDEMCWSPLGSAMLARLSAGLDAEGRIVTWRQDVWSNGFMGRPTMGGDPRLLALTHLAGGRPMPPAPDLQPANWMGASRNAVPGYDIPGHACHPAPAAGHADQDVLAAVARRAPQRVRDRVVHGRTGRRGRRRPGAIPARPPHRPAGPAGAHPGRGHGRVGHPGPPRRHRLRGRGGPVQRKRGVLRRRGRGGGGHRYPGAQAVARGGRGPGHQSGRGDQPGRGRRRAERELDAARAGPVRPGHGSPRRAGTATRSSGSPRFPR